MNVSLPRTDLLPAGVPSGVIVLMMLGAIGLWLAIRLATRRGRGRLPRHIIIAIRIVTAAAAAWSAFQLLGRIVVFGCQWPVWAAALALGTAVEIMAALYARERRVVPGRAGLLLTLLRACSLTLAVIIILQPILLRNATRRIERCVAVLLDESDSMRFTDTEWSVSERLAIARQFGLLEERERLLPALEPLVALTPRLRPWAASELGGPRVPPSLVSLLDDGYRQARDLDDQLKAGELKSTTNAPLLSLQRQIRDALLPAFSEARQARRKDELARSHLLRIQESLDLAAELAVSARQAADEQSWRSLAPGRRAATDEVCATSRVAIARAILVRNRPDARSSLLEALSSRYAVKFYGLARGLQPIPLTPSDGNAAGATNGPTLSASTAQQSFRAVTDYASALETVLREIPSEQFAGVLLLTDGRHNGDAAVEPVARRLGAQEVPVNTILVGSTHAPFDIALGDVTAPESVYLGDRVRIRTQFTATGAAGRQTRVLLQHDGITVDETLVNIATDDEQREIRLTHAPGTNGLARYTLLAEPLAGERFASNNTWRVEVAISDDRTHVLIVDDYPRWDFRYLRNLFHGRDKSVHLQYFLLHPDRIADLDITNALPAASASRPFGESEAGALPASRDEWRKFDVIILGDLDATVLTAEVMANIQACVAERGALLVVAAGPRAMPNGFAADSPLAEMLPFHYFPRGDRPDCWLPPEPAFKIALAPSGKNHPVVLQSNSPMENEAIWQELPAFTWRIPLKRIKPGAEVLAFALPVEETPAIESATTVRNALDKMQAENLRREQNALIVVQNYGRGKVLALATDQSWRLRYRVGDTRHHRFWGQIIRWGLGERLRDGTPQLRIGTDRITYAPNDPIHLLARVLDEQFAGVDNARLTATLRSVAGGVTGEVSRVNLDYRKDSQGIYEASLPPQAAVGPYQITLERHDGGTQAPVSTGFLVATARRPLEMARVNASRDVVEGLARWSGGRVVDPAGASAMAEAFGEGSRTVREPLEVPLWNRPWLFFLLAGLITAEWILRKMRGLA
jgi:hypothetical protein